MAQPSLYDQVFAKIKSCHSTPFCELEDSKNVSAQTFEIKECTSFLIGRLELLANYVSQCKLDAMLGQDMNWSYEINDLFIANAIHLAMSKKKTIELLHLENEFGPNNSSQVCIPNKKAKPNNSMPTRRQFVRQNSSITFDCVTFLELRQIFACDGMNDYTLCVSKPEPVSESFKTTFWFTKGPPTHEHCANQKCKIKRWLNCGCS